MQHFFHRPPDSIASSRGIQSSNRILFTTVAPTAYAAENTAVVAEVQEGVGEEQGSVLDIVVDTAVGIGTTDKDSGWTRILNYIIDSIFG